MIGRYGSGLVGDLVERDLRERVVLDGDHDPAGAVGGQRGGPTAQGGGQVAVVRRGGPAPLHVAQDGGPDAGVQGLAKLVGEDPADAAKANRIGILVAPLLHHVVALLAAGPFGHGDDREALSASLPVPAHPRHLVHLVLDLG